MKYSLLAQNKGEKPYEIKCPINRLGDIFEFLKENPETRCNILLIGHELPDYFTKQVNFIKEVTKGNYTIRANDLKTLVNLIKEGYNAYYFTNVTNWETFNLLKEIGVSDIYIDGPLGFQCNLLKQAKGNINLRFSPTISPNGMFKYSRPECSFFVRPEDVAKYEDTFDICDFSLEEPATEKTLYEIYQRGFFDHNLNLIIFHMPLEVPNAAIRPEFAELRKNCGQKCEIPGRNCSICGNAFNLSSLTTKILAKEE